MKLLFLTVLFASAFQAHITMANPVGAKKEFDESPQMIEYAKMIKTLFAENQGTNPYDGETDTAEIKPGLIAETELANELSLVTRYAGMGYNLLTGNPEGDFSIGGADPGIKTTKFIFKHTYTKGNENDAYYRGKPLKVPDQVTFQTTALRSTSQRSDAYSGQQSYRKELLLGVDASASYQGLFSASFALSTGMKQASETMEKRKSIIIQNTEISQLGEVSYNMASALIGAPGYDLTDEFKNAIRLLPSTYSAEKYTQFLDEWGTHIIEQLKVGTRKIRRRRVSYEEVYKFLSEQNSVGVTIGGGYGGVSGSISLNIDTLDESINVNTRIGESFTSYDIGTEEIPAPIKIKLVAIDEAMASSFWDDSERSEINQKRTHLCRALFNYANNKGARIAKDPSVTIEVQWPGGRYSLPQPKAGCPAGWTSGWRGHDNENNNNKNTWNPRNLNDYVQIGLGADYTIFYCTKTYTDDSGFAWPWPKGNYCIARYGGSCPTGFNDGEIYWDDENDNNGNSLRSPYPDGVYGADTLTHFCCRSDGSAAHEVLLPPTEPFVLWRYNGICQKVREMKDPLQLDIYFDDEDDSKGDRCGGVHPDDPCSDNHVPSMCFYSPRN